MIIPSIDLSCGRAVQLRQGREKALERDDPLALAREFSKYGEIAVVDLDAAFGTGNNDALIRKICRLAECRVGGGIRSIERAGEILSFGAEKVVIGTKAFEKNRVNHDFLKALNSAVGKDRVIIALDSLYGEIVTQAWQSQTGLSIEAVMQEVESYASELLFTCVEREGMMRGADFEAIKKLRAAAGLLITAAGGISIPEEIEKLSRLGVNAQLGMALYTGKISLPDAFIASLQWENELIATVAIDRSSQVLMLAYSSRKSLEKTFETENVWYYSRSRKKLWMKGETSGNFQKFLKIRTDCDGDALLVTVDQKGHACHTGKYSCFGNRAFSLDELHDVIRERLAHPSPCSYTSSLTDEKLKQKIKEEAGELADAQGKEEIIWEAADVLYFISVLLAKKGLSVDSVLSELKRRRRTPEEGNR
jgi:phosphoribosyl-ATP pyrophosphohydrolase/phosphoribosyl-AMP cyclohydrolase